MDSFKEKALNIMGRMFALFLTSSLGTIGGSSILNSFTSQDITVWQSAALAGFVSVATVAQKLAQASLDGELSKQEINEAFGGKAVKGTK